MKASKYNYFIPHSDRLIVFNGITKRFFFVSKENSGKFIEILESPSKGEFQSKYAPFLERMRTDGFVCDDDVDEMDLVRKEFERQHNPDRYMLMILPTYQCNLRCWYCTQDHEDVSLTAEMVSRIKRHIAKYLLESKVRKFRLAWFGGEPLLAYPQMLEVTRHSQLFCDEHGIDFSCDVTTNSLLLTPERIRELGRLGVRSYQVTIDGCREAHNQVKRTQGDVAFDTAVHNVLEIVRTVPGSSCILRINYSDRTLEPAKIMHDVNLLIPPEYRSRVTISPCKIWQVDGARVKKERVDELHRIAHLKNYRVYALKGSLCYVDGMHFNCLFPNGRVGKCDNAKMSEANGFLTEAGDVVWAKPNVFETHSALS